MYIPGGPNTKPLPNYQKVVSNRIEAFEFGYIYIDQLKYR